MEQAISSVQTLRPPVDEEIVDSGETEMVSLPPELATETAERIVAAAEMGDVTTINSIAEEIRAHSDSFTPLSKRIVQLAEDFEFDEVLKLADDLDAC